MDEIYDALRAADLFVSIGTSGAVYPAAGFVRNARDLGAAPLELDCGHVPQLESPPAVHAALVEFLDA